MFDTLKYTNGAMKAGYTRDQAEFQAAEMSLLIEETLATKEDLLKLKNDLVIKLGGMMIICSSVIVGVLGFIVKI